MLTLADLSIRRGGRVLFEHADATVPAGQRCGIVGANGCGKSSLFELILGRIEADAGELAVAGDPVIAHVAQQFDPDSRDPVQHALDGDVELRQVERQLASAGGTRLAELEARYQEIDGYGAPARAARILTGLGFDPERLAQPADTLSGGWRMRINLARALMCRSDLLLLDEPTNHLDLDAVIWLEDWLLRYPGTLLLISHDREFLDRIVNQVLAIERQRLTAYRGGYSDYETVRSAHLAQQQAAHRRQQREIAHMESFVSRFRAKATKARQAQSRLKALERMQRIAPAHVDSPFHFTFRRPDALADPLLRLVDVDAGYPGRAVLSAVNLSLAPGDRIGLLGLNGAGKSTLSRLLAGQLSAAGGETIKATRLVTGYFAQEQLEQLRPADTPAEHFRHAFELHDEQLLRDFLGGFGFSGDRVFEPVAPFSGGEKARLVLAMLVYRRPNLLILDEPTNHLDLDMRHALTVALQEFEGALVLVSHDRHLLRAAADRLLLVDGGSVAPFDGDVDDYPRWLRERRREDTDTAERPSTSPSRRDRRRQEAALRQQLKPFSERVRSLERRLDGLTAENAGIDEALADSALYQDSGKTRLTELLREQGRLREQIAEVEVDLLQAMEDLEQAEREAACR